MALGTTTDDTTELANAIMLAQIEGFCCHKPNHMAERIIDWVAAVREDKNFTEEMMEERRSKKQVKSIDIIKLEALAYEMKEFASVVEEAHGTFNFYGWVNYWREWARRIEEAIDGHREG